LRKKIIMEKLTFKIMHLGEWSVVNSNPETKYYQVEGNEASGQVVKLWLPMAIVDTIVNREEQVKKKDSYRKTADYFKNERNDLHLRNSELAKAIDDLKKRNMSLEESVGMLGFMNEDMSDEINNKFHKHRVTTTILGFLAVIEAIAFLGYYFIMQN
jgi:hypothetical protein